VAVDKSKRKYVRKSVQNAETATASTPRLNTSRLKRNAAQASSPTQPIVQPLSAEATAEKIEKGMNIMTEATQNQAETRLEETMDTIKTSTAKLAEKATGAFNDMQVRAKEAFASTGDLAKDAIAFQKSNLEALTTASKIAAASVSEGASASMAFNKKSWEATTAHAKAMTAVRSPTAFFDLQRTFATKQIEAMTAELPKVSAFWMKLASDVAAPLQQRVVKASEEVQARLAA
jgi:hypothetical protein